MKLWRFGRPIEYLDQRYRLDGVLGSGGMADVCLAWDEREQQEVAVKILKSDDLDQVTLNRFIQESMRTIGWEHPHILRIYESRQIELINPAQSSVLFYLVMEYARGGDLQKRLTPGKPFSLSAGFALFRQLCDAVQYAHEQGMIHRDLKPLNILFRRPALGPEEVVLSDFGLAVQIEASHHTFARGGTLAYMAPEQFQGNAQPASDIFALGVILYQLCTGQLPFRRALQDLPRLLSGPIPTPARPSLLNPELPPGLDEVILRALQEFPAERYRSAREYWDAIALVLTATAQTFPFVEGAWNAAGSTWPFDGSEKPPVSGQGSRPALPASSSSLPVEFQTLEQEGSAASPASIREKQKASPGVVPGLSLPTHSIPVQPNQRGQFAPDPANPRAFQTGGQTQEQVEAEEGPGPGNAWEDRRNTGSTWDGQESPARRPWSEQDSADLWREKGLTGSTWQGQDSPAGRSRQDPDESQTPGQALPSASASGSITLSRSPRSRGDVDPRSSRTHSPANVGGPDSNAPASQATRANRPGASPIPPSRSDHATSGRVAPGTPAPAQAPRPTRSLPRTHSHVEVDSASDIFTPFNPPHPSTPADFAAAEASALHSAADIADLPFASNAPPRQFAREASVGTPARSHASSAGPRQQSGLQPLRVQRKNPPRRRKLPLVPVVTTASLLALLLAIFLAASLQGPLLHLLGAPVTTVTVTPRSQQVTQDLALTAVPTAPDPTRSQVQVRSLSATSPTQSATATASGSIPAKRATGQLTFINNTAHSITIQTTILLSNSGEQISFDGPISAPANPPTIIVQGFAVTPGTSGNIPTLDLSKACCAPNNEIFVKNTAFTGGQDAQPDSVIEQKDIDGAVNPLETTLKQSAQSVLQGQVRGNERVIDGSLQCQPQIIANHKAGDTARTATVQVTEVCSEQVYDYAAAQQIALKVLNAHVASDPTLGAGYALNGQLALSVLSATSVNGAGKSFTLTTQAQGLWLYSFSQDRLRQLAALIAGKSQADARSLLLRQPGIATVQFSASGPLPVNIGEITVTVRKQP